jgi:CBS-domain-containing membrane protein
MTLTAATARDLMTPGPVSVPADRTAAQAVAFFADHGFGAAVVTDPAGRPVGVVTKTDLLIHARSQPPGQPDTATVREVMTGAVFSVRDDAPARTVVEQFVALNVHHLFVTDAGGAVVGVITPLDVLRTLR